MPGPYSAKLISITPGTGNENIVARIQIFNGDGTVRETRDFPSNTLKPDNLPIYMQEMIKIIEEKDAGLAEFAKIDLSSPIALALPRDEAGSPINAFYAALALLRERLDEYAHGLRPLDDPAILSAREAAMSLFKAEYKKDPRWFGRG